MNLSSKQFQRWSAVALLLAMILLFGLMIIMPLMNKALALHESKNNLVFRLQQYQQIVAKKQSLMLNMASMRQQYQKLGLLNKQTTGAMASAELQEFIKKTITEAKGQLSSTQALPVAAFTPANQIGGKNEFNQITVSVRMTGNSDVLRAVLYKIETSTPLIIINQIDIRPMRGSTSTINHQIEASNELNINFQALSFMRRQQQ